MKRQPQRTSSCDENVEDESPSISHNRNSGISNIHCKMEGLKGTETDSNQIYQNFFQTFDETTKGKDEKVPEEVRMSVPLQERGSQMLPN